VGDEIFVELGSGVLDGFETGPRDVGEVVVLAEGGKEGGRGEG